MSGPGLTIPDEGFLRDWVDALEAHSEAPAEGYLGVGLALLSACFGPQLRTQYRSPVTLEVAGGEYGHVWVLMLGPSAAAHKSTVGGAARDAIRAVQSQLGASWEDYLRVHSLNAGRVSDAGLVSAYGAKDEEEAERWYSTRPPGRFLDANEVAPLFGPVDGAREEKWTADARHALLTVYDGHVSSETKETKVPRSPVSAACFANCTRAGLEDRLRSSTVSSGFFARWVPIMVRATDKSFSFPVLNGSGGKLSPWWGTIARLVEQGGIVDHVPQLYSRQALEMRADWYDPRNRELKAAALEADDDPDGDPLAGLRLSAFKRWQATAHKLATLHALSIQAPQLDRLGELEIDTASVRWGLDVVDEAAALLEELLEAGERAPSMHKAKEDRVLRHVKTTAAGLLTLRDLSKKTGLSTDEVAYLCETSEYLGLIRRLETGKGGRKPSVVYLADQYTEEEVATAWSGA